MAVSVTLGGVTYSIPSPGDSNDWGAALNAYLIALGTSAGAKSPIAFTFGASQTENAVRYMSVGGAPWPYGSGLIATGPCLVAVPVAGSITRMDIQFSPNIASSTGTITFTVQKLTAGTPTDTTMVVVATISGITGTKAHLSTVLNPFTVVAGDAVSIKLVDTGMSAAAQGIIATLTLTPS